MRLLKIDLPNIIWFQLTDFIYTKQKVNFLIYVKFLYQQAINRSIINHIISVTVNTIYINFFLF